MITKYSHKKPYEPANPFGSNPVEPANMIPLAFSHSFQGISLHQICSIPQTFFRPGVGNRRSVRNYMMVNHMYDNDDYGKILLDTTEPFAKKILKFFTYWGLLEILELTENPILVNDKSAKSGYSKISICRRFLICLMPACSLQWDKKRT